MKHETVKDPYIFRYIVYRFFQTYPLGFKSTSLGKKDFYDVISQNEIRGPRAYFLLLENIGPLVYFLLAHIISYTWKEFLK